MKANALRSFLDQLEAEMGVMRAEGDLLHDKMSQMAAKITDLKGGIIMEEGLLSEVQWRFTRIGGDGTVELDGEYISEYPELDKLSRDAGWYHYDFNLIKGKSADKAAVTIRVDDDELRLYIRDRPVERIKELKLNVSYDGVKKDIAEHEHQLLILTDILKKLAVE